MNTKYRKAIIAGNWKMNMLVSEIKPYMDELKTLMPKTKRCETIICVPAVNIPTMLKLGKEAKILVGAEDVSNHYKGAYTGDISAAQLADIGVKYCIVGHSERRERYKENDLRVNGKVLHLLDLGITPIICVGETGEQREKGLTLPHINYQIRAALAGVDVSQLRKCIIAYEPIWAIGTGNTATAEQAEEVCREIRAIIRDIYGARPARGISILYGGSMNPKNAESLLAQPDIDGGLIGGAALKPADFAAIINAVGTVNE